MASFRRALEDLKKGREVTRIKWPYGVFVSYRNTTFFKSLEDGSIKADWTPTAEDLIAEDWFIDILRCKTLQD